MTNDPKLEELFNNPEAREDALIAELDDLITQIESSGNERDKAFVQLALAIKIIVPNATMEQFEDLMAITKIYTGRATVDMLTQMLKMPHSELTLFMAKLALLSIDIIERDQEDFKKRIEK